MEKRPAGRFFVGNKKPAVGRFFIYRAISVSLRRKDAAGWPSALP
jgi:hypothetical protein